MPLECYAMRGLTNVRAADVIAHQLYNNLHVPLWWAIKATSQVKELNKCSHFTQKVIVNH